MADEPAYVDLNGVLAILSAFEETNSIAELVGQTDLSDLAREVKLKTINALLLARAPDVLDPNDTDRFALFLEALAGASTEVEALVGADPQPPARRALAIRAIAFATAADLEESLFPEQQVGDSARAAYLRRRYDAILTMLDSQDTDTGIVPGDPSPVGSFPLPSPEIWSGTGDRGWYATPGLGYYPC